MKRTFINKTVKVILRIKNPVKGGKQVLKTLCIMCDKTDILLFNLFYNFQFVLQKRFSFSKLFVRFTLLK